MKYRWVPNPELKAICAAERKKQADAWRSARRANTKIARLLWRRVRAAQAKIAEDIWSAPS